MLEVTDACITPTEETAIAPPDTATIVDGRFSLLLYLRYARTATNKYFMRKYINIFST